MSQKFILIAFSILLIMTVALAKSEAKRVGCASFGHSCYGGHGKRSDTEFTPQEIEPIENQQGLMRALQRRFPPSAIEISANDINEKDIMKPMILNMLRELIDETNRKIKEIESA